MAYQGGGGFAAGILQGQSIFQGFHNQFQQGQQQRELAAVAEAKPETSTGFTAEQGKELESLPGKATPSNLTKARTHMWGRTTRATCAPWRCRVSPTLQASG